MRIDVLTLLPDVVRPYLDESILGRAQELGAVSFFLHNIRDHATGNHRITDEPPYGGGGGMVLKPEPIFTAVKAIAASKASPVKEEGGDPSLEYGPIILLTPQGRRFDQSVAQELSQHEELILICGRYEGVDERVRRHLATDEISIGDYVLTGGELAAMVLIDAVVRLVPGVLGAENAAGNDSFATGLLEGPHYTRPHTFRSWQVPELLRSGHDANIKRWRRQQALRRTWWRKPELLLTARLTESDKLFLATLARETG
jgi:tRNA (guanine37-N1)-methyltransferase